jgi:hypothetical protein
MYAVDTAFLNNIRIKNAVKVLLLFRVVNKTVHAGVTNRHTDGLTVQAETFLELRQTFKLCGVKSVMHG